MKKIFIILLFLIFIRIYITSQIERKYFLDKDIYYIEYYDQNEKIFIDKYEKESENKINISQIRVSDKVIFKREIFFEPNKVLFFHYNDDNKLYYKHIYYYNNLNQLIKHENFNFDPYANNQYTETKFYYDKNKLIKEENEDFLKTINYNSEKIDKITYYFKQLKKTEIEKYYYIDNNNYYCTPTYDFLFFEVLEKKEHFETIKNDIKEIKNIYYIDWGDNKLEVRVTKIQRWKNNKLIEHLTIWPTANNNEIVKKYIFYY